MKAYEIINPSDQYILQAPDLELAAIAVLHIGHGKYSLNDEQGEQVVPFFMFGGLEEWLQEKFGDPSFENLLTKVKRDRFPELIAVFDSVMIGGFQDLKSYECALANIPTEEGRAKFKEEWRDVRRSSLNDIGRYAASIAVHLRHQMESEKCQKP